MMDTETKVKVQYELIFTDYSNHRNDQKEYIEISEDDMISPQTIGEQKITINWIGNCFIEDNGVDITLRINEPFIIEKKEGSKETHVRYIYNIIAKEKVS